MHKSAPNRSSCAALAVALAIAASLILPPPVGADYATPALGTLIAESETVAFGVVAAVSDGPGAGDFSLQIDFDELLAGTQRTSWSAAGSDLDAGGVQRLTPGTALLAFVPTGAATEERVIPVATSGKDDARTIVQTVVAKGSALRLADVSAQLLTPTAGAGAPQILIDMLLEELTARVTSDEASGLAAIACSDDGSYRGNARLWAVARSGTLAIAEARSCLEAMLAKSEQRDFAIAAADALGDLGASESVAVLLGVLPAKPHDPKLRAKDAKTDVAVGVGSSDDPEDESTPTPDTGESPGQSSDTYDGAAAGGGTSPDDPETSGVEETGKLADPSRRRGDAGLTVTAVLALGKIGDTAAVAPLARIAKEGDDLALHSTVVNALGLIGDKRAVAALKSIAKRHQNPLVRAQAAETLSRLY